MPHSISFDQINANFAEYITRLEKRPAKQATLKQEELLDRAEKIAKLGHWHADLKKGTVLWSKEVYRIHGLDPEDSALDITRAIEFYHGKDRKHVEKAIERAIKDQSDFTFEADIVRPCGEIRHVRSSGECTVDDNGEVTSIFGIFQDITESITALEQIEKSNAFLQLVTNTIPDMLFVKDKEFRIIQANDAFINAYPSNMHDKIIGFTTLESYDDAEAEEFLEEDKKAFKYGVSEKEEKVLFPDGVTRNLSTKKVHFVDAKGEEYILGICRDISQITDAQDALLKANQELEEFAYRASHDLRSPLVSSIGMLGLINEFIKSGEYEQAQSSMPLVISSLRKLEELVKSILQLTKTKNLEEEKTPVHFPQIIDETLEKLSFMENFERLSIQQNYTANEKLTLPKSRIVLIVENLISNAIKYQDTNEETPYIKISTYETSAEFVFQVEDNGLGIEEQHREKLFGMFQRFHSRVSFGSGLGLYMLKNSAEIIGGQIVYEAKEKGSTFKFIIKK